MSCRKIKRGTAASCCWAIPTSSAIGAGNVLPDLVRLGVPTVRLEQQFRQQENAEALRYNVTHFPQLSAMDELRFDDSFQLIEAEDAEIAGVICREATVGASRARRSRCFRPSTAACRFPWTA